MHASENDVFKRQIANSDAPKLHIYNFAQPHMERYNAKNFNPKTVFG